MCGKAAWSKDLTHGHHADISMNFCLFILWRDRGRTGPFAANLGLNTLFSEHFLSEIGSIQSIRPLLAARGLAIHFPSRSGFKYCIIIYAHSVFHQIDVYKVSFASIYQPRSHVFSRSSH